MPNWVKAVIGLAFAALLVVIAIRFLDPNQGGQVQLPGGGGVTVDGQGSTGPDEPSPSPDPNAQPGGNNGTPPLESRPPIALEPVPEPAPGSATRPSVVRLDVGGTVSRRGMTTPNGFIVTLFADGIENSVDLEASWTLDGSSETAPVEYIDRDRAGLVALLRLTEGDYVAGPIVVRTSVSLAQGDAIEALLGEHQISPGRVNEINGQRTVLTGQDESVSSQFLVSTRIFTAGDAGAPVLDSEGRLVGMAYGSSQVESLSVPVEAIRLAFPDAF